MHFAPPHPAQDGFANAYGRAWTKDPEMLCAFFAPDGSYADVAMRGTYRGHKEILRFHRWMSKFSPDSLIVFGEPAAQDGRAYFEWIWSGSITGPLQIPGGSSIDAAGQHFSVEGIADCRYDTDGKLISHRDFWDVGLLTEQLGYTLVPQRIGN